MNAHDSERIKGMLEGSGSARLRSQEEADVIVFNTCTVREKPDQRFAAHLAQARALKEADRRRSSLSEAATRRRSASASSSSTPYVDVAFGPGSIPHLADWVGAGGEGIARGRFAELDQLRGRPAGPAGAAVPGVGADLDGLQLEVLVLHRAGRARAGAEQAARRHRRGGLRASRADGVSEVTLLGQNVNSWGRDLAPGARDGVRRAASRRSTESTGSSGSASRARTRRTFEIRSSPRWPSASRVRAHPPAAAVGLDAAS